MNAPQNPNTYRSGPDENGRFGLFGGRFVAETLMPLVLSLEQAYEEAKVDPAFQADMARFLKHYVGRPSPLYFAERMTEHLGGAKIYFKRDELNHTGAHKVNNVLGQILLARRMGKKRIIAETGAGQHGVATATLCARFGLECIVYMGAVDVSRQSSNVFRMKMLGAQVVPVQSGTKTLKDAMNEALRDWVTNVADTFYCIGTAAGPHPYPAMVRDFQSVIGKETREQMQEAEGRLPDSLIAAIGGGSNAIGLFHPFLDDSPASPPPRWPPHSRKIPTSPIPPCLPRDWSLAAAKTRSRARANSPTRSAKFFSTINPTAIPRRTTIASAAFFKPCESR